MTLDGSCKSNILKSDSSLSFSSGGSNIGSQDYQIGTTAVNLTPLYSSSINPSACPLTATLAVYDETTSSWKD